MKIKWTFLFAVILVSACSEPIEVDTIIHNATIYTVDETFQKAEAIAIKDGKIVEVGAEHQILNGYSAEDVIDAKQGFLYPGFIDAHSHFMGYSLQQQRVDLIGTTSFKEVVERIVAYAEKHDTDWILGRGWDQNNWAINAFPNNDTFDILFPDKYVAVRRVDGHAMLASNNVLALAGITSETQIDGGKVLLEDSEPTGILIDAAMKPVKDVIPEPSDAFKSDALINAQKNLFAAGLTSVCDAGLPIEDIRLIDSLHKQELMIKVYAMYSADDQLMQNLAQYRIQTDKLTARSVKVYADGALGSRGAVLIEPYTDDPENIGLMITPKDSVKEWAEVCAAANFQLNVHCIGDGANRKVLDAMGEVLGGTNDRRWRIEHAQVVHPEDRSKYGRFNILPSMQPTHATSDMYWADERLGEDRIEFAYTLKSLMEENGLIPLGTDFPVEGISPIRTYYAATFRKDEQGFPEDGFQIEEALSREDALKGITIWAAIANFEEDTRGSIVPGKSADLVLLDRDIVTTPEASILESEVLKTWVDGKIVHEK